MKDVLSGGGAGIGNKLLPAVEQNQLMEDMLTEDGCGDDQSQDEGRRKKKARTTFTGRQIFELEKQFEIKKYLSSSERAEMAKLLNVTETQVSDYFLFIIIAHISKYFPRSPFTPIHYMIVLNYLEKPT